MNYMSSFVPSDQSFQDVSLFTTSFRFICGYLLFIIPFRFASKFPSKSAFKFTFRSAIDQHCHMHLDHLKYAMKQAFIDLHLNLKSCFVSSYYLHVQLFPHRDCIRFICFICLRLQLFLYRPIQCVHLLHILSSSCKDLRLFCIFSRAQNSTI